MILGMADVLSVVSTWCCLRDFAISACTLSVRPPVTDLLSCNHHASMVWRWHGLPDVCLPAGVPRKAEPPQSEPLLQGEGRNQPRGGHRPWCCPAYQAGVTETEIPHTSSTASVD